jgi:metal-responsive CopG/Arc/MetJ family transcriptional regulator
MKAIQLMWDEATLREIDRAAKRQKTDRSKFIRGAVEKVLRDMRRAELEEKDLRAYRSRPQKPDEHEPWQQIQAWPDE